MTRTTEPDGTAKPSLPKINLLLIPSLGSLILGLWYTQSAFFISISLYTLS